MSISLNLIKNSYKFNRQLITSKHTDKFMSNIKQCNCDGKLIGYDDIDANF